MGNTIVIGMHWGDEGKGKLVDILAEEHDAIVRFNGGGNAGHTVVADGIKYVLHQIPSGILRNKLCVIGNQTAVDAVELVKEIGDLIKQEIHVSPENLAISHLANLTLGYHNALDRASGGEIGTTVRGIGPTYADRKSRGGLIFNDLFDIDKLKKKVQENTEFTNYVLNYYKDKVSFEIKPLDFSEVFAGLLNARERILPFICKDIGSLILKHDGSLLFEGAQGTLLDNDLGSYPFATSSNTTIGGAYVGGGVKINFDRIIGLLKAYTTRVGKGPFPSEQDNETGARLQERGGEFGATTGRARRCGWLDLFAAKYSVRVNGIGEISLSKLDILDEEEEIKICSGY